MDKNFISGLENAEARKKSLQVVPPTQIDYAQAPYFVDYVREGLRKEWLDSAADSGDSLVVYTTLHIDLQGAAFRAIQTGLAEIDALLSDQSPGDSPQVSLIAVDPRTGEILALVGGRNYGLSQYNRVTKAFRQPGSTFKPFVYAAAQQTNLHPSITYFHTLSTLLLDEPYTFQFEKKRIPASKLRRQVPWSGVLKRVACPFSECSYRQVGRAYWIFCRRYPLSESGF